MSNINEIVNNLIEKNGKFQIILIILLCLNSIQVGINHTITSFHIYTPNFYCDDDNNNNFSDGNSQCYNNDTKCTTDNYVFDLADDKTVAVEWSLVCDRAYLTPIISSLYFVGVTIGSIVCSTLCDIWGRKYLVLTCMYMQAIMSFGLYISNSLHIFIIFRIIQGFFIQGLQTCSYTLMLEYCPSKYRTMAAVLWELNWAIGLGILGACSYFIRDWRILTLVLIIPTVLSLIYFWIIPESLSWLCANKRYKQAHELVLKISKKNNDMHIYDDCNSIALTEKNNIVIVKKQQQQQHDDDNDVHNKMLADGDGDDKLSQNLDNSTESKTSLFDILRNRILRKHLLVMICVWFSVTLSYYGILYFLPSLAGQRHVNFLVGAAIEAIAYILAYFTLSRFGRKIPMVCYQYINCILCISMGLLKLIAHTSGTYEWLLICIALVAKGIAVSSFCGMFIYCSELFPTICRGLALGLCGFAARCGSLLAPQLMFMVNFVPAYVPMMIIAGFLIVTGTATLLLPETISSRLPNTVDEANSMWDKKKLQQ